MECSIYGGAKKEDVIDEEVPCFVMEGSPGGDVAKPENCEALIVNGGSAVAEARTEQKNRSTVMGVKEKPVTQDPFTLRKVLQAQKKKSSAENVPSRWVTRLDVSTTTGREF